ncbi:MAG: hypothetical protein LC804_13265, partial [Acidobacteria bacterium]|nr:hypothetical protein [Acidobacteriota bacterium]
NESLEGRPMAETVRTIDLAVTLVLTAEELRTLLADNTDLVSGLFATLAARLEQQDRAVHSTQAARELAQLAAGGMSPVEKILAVQRVPIFSRVSAEEMRTLAGIASTVSMTAGSQLFPESAPATLWLLLSGEVALTSTAGAPVETAVGGDTIGSFATMAGVSLGLAAQVVQSGTALRIDRGDLFDLLGERPELLRQMFAGMFRLQGAPASA